MRFITVCFLLIISIGSSLADDVDYLYKSAEQQVSSEIEGYPYLGGNFGWGYFQDACGTSVKDCTDDALSYGVYAGYQFTTYFALEAAINSYGSLKANDSSDKSSVDIWEGDLAMVFTLPVSAKASLYSKLGGAYTSVDKEINSAAFASADEWDVVAALGVNYRLSQNWALRGEYKFIDGVGNTSTGQADLHSAMLGLTYNFVRAKSPIAETAEPNEYEQQSVASVSEEVSLSSEALFEFDSATLKYNKNLEKYVEKLTYYRDGKIKIIGYTDSVGASEYNQRLSELRAQSVADYFKRMGLNQSRIEAEGRGEENFKASNDTETGRAQNRRVEINFTTQVESTK